MNWRVACVAIEVTCQAHVCIAAWTIARARECAVIGETTNAVIIAKSGMIYFSSWALGWNFADATIVAWFITEVCVIDNHLCTDPCYDLIDNRFVRCGFVDIYRSICSLCNC